MRCRICKKRATIKIKGFAYCEDCFNKMFYRRVERLIKKFKIIRKGERILIAISGGKDSNTCAYVLKKLEEKYQFELQVFHINLGLPPSKVWENTVKEFCKKNDLPLHILNFEKVAKEDVAIISTRTSRPVCSVCGLVKRYWMNKFARENGFDKLATGHNADDILSFFFKNWTSKNFEWIWKLKPITPSTHKKVVTKIRPLYELDEEEILTFAKINGVEFSKVKCPFSMKNKWKEIGNFAERKIRGFKVNFLRALEELEVPVKTEEFKECKICGEPTNMEVCSYCRLIRNVENFHLKYQNE